MNNKSIEKSNKSNKDWISLISQLTKQVEELKTIILDVYNNRMIGNEGKIENQPIKEMFIAKVNKINPPSIEQVIQKPNKVLL